VVVLRNLPKGSGNHPGLSEYVPGIVRDLFWRLSLESHHGKTFVSHAMGYLKASRNGLTEDETLDTLSQNDEVMKDFKKRSRTVDIILLPGWVAPITCKFS
jgi:hypothetical protein